MDKVVNTYNEILLFMRKKECYHLDLEGIMLNKSERKILYHAVAM